MAGLDVLLTTTPRVRVHWVSQISRLFFNIRSLVPAFPIHPVKIFERNVQSLEIVFVYAVYSYSYTSRVATRYVKGLYSAFSAELMFCFFCTKSISLQVLFATEEVELNERHYKMMVLFHPAY